MKTIDYVILAIVALVLGLAAYFIYRSKKSGKRCIGCPDSGKCSGQCAGCHCGCHLAEEK